MNLTKNQKKALDLNRNLVVSAGAGSGKTTVLVNRFIHILINEPSLELRNIVAITFTKKAATELKEKIFIALNDQFTETPQHRERIFQILNQFNDAQIFTIHGWCANLLRQYSVESAINPDFLVISDFEKEDFLSQSFKEFFFNYSVDHSNSDRLKVLALREFSLRRLQKFLFQIYDARAILLPILELNQNQNPKKIQKFWEQKYIEYHLLIHDGLLNSSIFFQNLNKLTELELAESPTLTEKQLQAEIGDLLKIYHNEATKKIDKINALNKIIMVLTKKDGGAYQRIPGSKKIWGEEGTFLFLKLSQYVENLSPLILLIDPKVEKIFSEVLIGIILIIFDFFSFLEQKKERINGLDFEDLQLKTIQLLKNQPHIREQIRDQHPYILVDEFQDTDTLQSEIIYLLLHQMNGRMDKNRLFVVGDPQQSIFGFRYADVTIFKNYEQKILQQGSEKIPIQAAEDNTDSADTLLNRKGIISLSQNFRSTSKLIQFYNSFFSTIFTKESQYDVNFFALETATTDQQKSSSKIQLNIFYGDTQEKIDLTRVQSEKIGQEIYHLVTPNNIHTENTQASPLENPNLSFGDIAILIRSRTHLEVLERTLRNQNIPYQTFKGKGFFQSQEIIDIFYILLSVTNPEDDFALLTFLRSPFVGVSDATLFYLKQVKGGSYWEKLQKFDLFLKKNSPAEDIFNQDFCQFIKNKRYNIHLEKNEKIIIHYVVTRIPLWNELALNEYFSQLLDLLIENLQIRAVLASHPDFDQKLANLDKFVQYIFAFEQNHSAVLTNFLEHIKKQILGTAQEGDATILSENSNKVTILTYHSAKGMEFPVVFLPFLEDRFRFNDELLIDKVYGTAFRLENSENPGDIKPLSYQFLKMEERNKINAEEKRLLYVAMTRAKTHLYLIGGIKKDPNPPEHSYLFWLINFLQINDQKQLFNKKFTFLHKNIEIILTPIQAERETAPFPVKEKLDRRRLLDELQFLQEELKYSDFIEEKKGGQSYSTTQLMLFEENRDRYFRHFYLSDGNIFPPHPELEYLDDPGDPRWGSLVHKLLENYQLRPKESDQQKIEQLLLMFGIVTQEETSNLKNNLSELISRFRGSTIGKALAKGRMFSEFSVELFLDGFTLTGIFDVLFENEKGAWEVLDFKTNRIQSNEVESVAKKYLFQMEAYALLLSALKTDQTSFSISLLFLHPMKIFHKLYNKAELNRIQDRIIQLMHTLFTEEAKLFY
jgi:ATP-dependent helicase/nuclease subunit A